MRLVNGEITALISFANSLGTKRVEVNINLKKLKYLPKLNLNEVQYSVTSQDVLVQQDLQLVPQELLETPKVHLHTGIYYSNNGVNISKE